MEPSHLFSCHDGALYDTRAPGWASAPPLRPIYRWHFAHIDTVAQFKACLRAGATVYPGGLPLYFIAGDGEPISFKSARENLRQIVSAIQDARTGLRINDSWNVIGCAVNEDDNSMRCAHSGEVIPSACGDAADVPEPEPVA